ncbi:MAG: mechanosensitive ion channel family protein [candidate division KSB1 bacterium]|nr:mechanosensitive ion channel family protein [candidate division KSB1 bacterium]MDZ7319260.1 mechanosensitive ion channel family protein [candidate division KSB1 bacterium]MDZ7341132.1 mechanosensitive ion channel family protein [candidate division KSB1 bacterium]
MKDTLQISEWILPAVLIVGGVVVGLIFEKIVLIKLKKIAAKTKWAFDEIIVASLHGMLLLWFILAGAFGAIVTMRMRPDFFHILDKIILLIFIFSVTLVFTRIAVGLFNFYSKSVEGVLPSTSILSNLTRLVVFSIGILIMFHSIGVSIMPILTALGVGGLAVALALQDTLANLFAGLHIIASRQIRPGDFLRLDSGEEGAVTDITWRSTTIKTFPNNLVIVPNSKLASAIVTNYSLPNPIVKVYVPIGVSYDSDLTKVEQVTAEVARSVMTEVPGGVADADPVIRFNKFGEFSIDFTVIMFAKQFRDQHLLRHEFIKRLHERYQKEGIEIPFPIRTLYTKDKNQ